MAAQVYTFRGIEFVLIGCVDQSSQMVKIHFFAVDSFNGNIELPGFLHVSAHVKNFPFQRASPSQYP